MNPRKSFALAARTKSALRALWRRIVARARCRTAEQSEQFELALTNITQGLCMFDASGRIMLCNQKNEATRIPRLTGVTRCRLEAG